MQDSESSNQKKKILFIALGVALVVAVALGTTLILSRVSSPVPAEKAIEVPLSQKLVELYRSNGGATSETLNNAIVQNSGSVGYKNAHAKITGTKSDDGQIAYFYQTTDSLWHFFIATNNIDKVACNKYDTSDLISAFLGFTCWDTSKKKSSFVAQPQPVVNENDSPPGGSGG